MYNVGDRIKVKKYSQVDGDLLEKIKSSECEIIEISEAWSGGTRYKIRFLNVYMLDSIHSKNVSNLLAERWVDEDYFYLDVEYYRNLKIEKIL